MIKRGEKEREGKRQSGVGGGFPGTNHIPAFLTKAPPAAEEDAAPSNFRRDAVLCLVPELPGAVSSQ